MKAKKFFKSVKSFKGLAQWITYIVGLIGLVYLIVGIVAIFCWSLLVIIAGDKAINIPDNIFGFVINHPYLAAIIILCMAYSVCDYVKSHKRSKKRN